MQTTEKHNIDALLDLPEMKAALADFRTLQSDFRTELWIAFLETDEDELPDVRPLNERYDSRFRELKDRVRAIAKANLG